MLRDGLGSFNWNGKERVWKEEGRRDDGIFGVNFGGFGGFGVNFVVGRRVDVCEET